MGLGLSAALSATTPEVLASSGAYDALVIGAGAAGGLAALLLVEAGLRVLVLEAGLGRVQSLSDAEVNLDPSRQPIQSRCYAWKRAPRAFVDDIDCPYTTPIGRPFIWIRARQLGGRMLVPGHGRQYYRLGADDLAPKDGLSPGWPLTAADLDPWYAAVERRLGLSGTRNCLPWLPDSELSNEIEPTPAQAQLLRAIAARWPLFRPVLGRFASPFDSLEAAALTGRLLVRTGAIVREIEVDSSGHVSGVIWIDREKRTEERALARLVFLCASTLESTRILLLSRSRRSPDGLGARSGALGRYLMDHIGVSAEGEGPPLSEPEFFDHWRCLYLPRFDARDLSVPLPGRGFGVQLNHFSTESGATHFVATSFAEMLPQPENRVRLDPARRDAWGIPALHIDCAHRDMELTLAREQTAALREVAEAAGATLWAIDEVPQPPGIAIHESGTARMGDDPATSVLDPYNQCWDAQNLYVTDGACFPSQGTQNPTLTILALTARACHYALHPA